MAAPTLSVKSANRLTAVIDDAADLVDVNGMDPSEAIAKTAAEHGLPAGHIDLAVRGYNTGRLHRQLVSSTDPWLRAGAFETASSTKVAAILGGETQKKAVDLSDYEKPPVVNKQQKNSVDKNTVTKIASDYLGIQLQQPVEVVKVAEAKPETKNPTVLAVAFEAGLLLDKTFETLKYAAADEIAAVRQLATRFCGSDSTVKFAFDRFAKRCKNAGFTDTVTPPSPTVPNDHPAVVALCRIDELRRMPKSAASVSDKKKDDSTGIGSSFLSGLSSGYGSARLGGLLGSPVQSLRLLNNPKAEVKNPFIGGGLFSSVGERMMADSQKREKMHDKLLMDKLEAGQTDTKLPVALKALARQDVVNDVLADPRLKAADPSSVIHAYTTLSQLAPMAMSNSALAAAMIHQQMMTGPLSYFDLSQLAKTEADLAKARSSRGED